LPPYAFAPARAMCKQIRELFPKLKLIFYTVLAEVCHFQ
jgi:hypothetical protein